MTDGVSRSVVPIPCTPMDSTPPGSSVHEIFQVRILEWVAISFSRGSNQGLLQADSLLAELQGKLHDMVSTGKREEQQQLINDFVLIFL